MKFETISEKMGAVANNRYLTAIRDGMAVIILAHSLRFY